MLAEKSRTGILAEKILCLEVVLSVVLYMGANKLETEGCWMRVPLLISEI